jgi:ABC-type multidrug transport system fused ATPase/permease subunit
LFAGTVAANIAAGRPGASEAEIRAAARTAHCDAFITSWPAGYDTPLRAGAPNLSLGERQRIAIARALVATLR